VIRAAQDERTACQDGGGVGPSDGSGNSGGSNGSDGSGGSSGVESGGGGGGGGGEGLGGGCDLAARVQMFASLSFITSPANGGRTRAGGHPPASALMLVDATEGQPGAAPGASWIKPAFYTGPPVCKGFGTQFAALVRHGDPAFRCDRGCSFD